MTWQTIESAPKDGTRILAYGRGTDRMCWDVDKEMPLIMSVVWWSWHDGERLEDAGDGLFRKVPVRVLEMWQPIGPHFFHPTHWQPLPDPPVTP